MDPKLLDQLYAEEPVHIGGHQLEPTPEQLKHLSALWPVRRKEDVAKALGVSLNVARRWYRTYAQPKGVSK